MKVSLLAVGPVRGPLADAAADFGLRARRYWKMEEIEVASGAPGSGASPESVRDTEGKRILKRLPRGLESVALTRTGRAMDSPAFARWLDGFAVSGAPGVVFVIGGAFGLSDAVLRTVTRTITLSPGTLPHDLARVVLLEQLYRAGTILRGEPYHKG